MKMAHFCRKPCAQIEDYNQIKKPVIKLRNQYANDLEPSKSVISCLNQTSNSSFASLVSLVHQINQSAELDLPAACHIHVLGEEKPTLIPTEIITPTLNLKIEPE